MSQTHGGKGSAQRPRQVDSKKFNDNWDLIFNKKKDGPDDEKPARKD
jgi:hypothetical protein